MTNEDEIKELKKRIEELERRPIPYYHPIIINNPPTPNIPPPGVNVHYHNGQPCYQNPCVWC